MKKAFFKLIFFSGFLFLFLPKKAYAYLDPGSGSYLIQIIVASIAGLTYLIKLNWRKIKSRFSSKGKEENENENKGDLL
jgi:hypothetical protein